jgi:CRP-like cAMP-binding protein
MYHEWTDTLNSSILFSNIDHGSLNVMLDCLKPKIRRCKQREIIVAYGQTFQGIGIIASGKVSLTKETYSGNRIMMGILEAGDIFGETVAFSDKKVWPMTVIAQEDSVLLFLAPEKITGTCANICASHNTLIINMLQILSRRALMLNKKIEHLSARSLRGKISSYLLDMYQLTGKSTFDIPMKRHELADYLNIPRPSLSREMTLMQDDNLIKFNGPNITINNVLMLEKLIR